MPDMNVTLDHLLLSTDFQTREAAAMAAHAHALRKGMTWRHALRDALAASDAAVTLRWWSCPTCGASYEP